MDIEKESARSGMARLTEGQGADVIADYEDSCVLPTPPVVVSVKWWKSVQRVIVRPADYAARFTASMS
jgi:hypothetical protein